MHIDAGRDAAEILLGGEIAGQGVAHVRGPGTG
jgi:hypothetical protein